MNRSDKTVYSILIVSLLIVLSPVDLRAMGTEPEAEDSVTDTKTALTDTTASSDTGLVEDGTDTESPTETDFRDDGDDTEPKNVTESDTSDDVSDTVTDAVTEGDTSDRVDDTGPNEVTESGTSGDLGGPEAEQVSDTDAEDDRADTQPDDTKIEVEISEAGAGRESLPFINNRGSKAKRTENQEAFQAGEKVVLRVTYLGFTAGYISVNVKQDTIENRPIYVLDMKAKTSGAGDWFYSASDRFVSYMDVEGLYSWGFDYFQNHEGEQDTQIVRYYQDKRFFAENGDRGGTIPLYTQDALSAVYYLRTQDLEVGEKYQFPVHVDDKHYNMIIRVKRIEKIATDDGWKEALLLRPTIEDPAKREEAKQHLQENSSGLRIWLSNDQHKIPLKVSLPAYFGSVYGNLHKYRPN